VRFTPQTYWCWGTPLGVAATDPRFIEMVRFNQGNLGGTSHAALVSAEVASRGLTKGQVAVEILNWGRIDTPTSLWRNAADGSGYGNETIVPFYANAVATVRAWTLAWIAEYQRRQVLNPSIPDPSAFWMDYEERITIGPTWTTQWADFKADPRWSTEVVTFDGRTWAEVVADASIPDPPSPGSGASVNAVHTIPVRPFLLESQSLAMYKAFFEPLQAAFPGVKTSNWQTTHDGLHLASEDAEFRYAAVTGGTHQAPVLYGSNPSAYAETYSREIDRGLVSDRLFSPWIEMYGENGIDDTNVDGVYRWTIQQTSLDGISDILLYADDGSGQPATVEANWDATVAAIDRALVSAAAISAALNEDFDDMSNKAPQQYTKHPSEIRSATMSFKHKLSPGDLLTGTPTVVAAPSGPTITAVAINAAEIEGDHINASIGEAVQFKIAGGTDGTAYRLTVTATTTGGETLVGLADLTVEDEA
jgi:hypothetical protein